MLTKRPPSSANKFSPTQKYYTDVGILHALPIKLESNCHMNGKYQIERDTSPFGPIYQIGHFLNS